MSEEAKTKETAQNDVPLLFTEFSWFPLPLDVHYGYLALKARPELWGMPDSPFVILDSYFIHTYIHVIKNNALEISKDNEFCCFNTGLLTSRLKDIYAVFQKNKNTGMQKWFFKGWFDYTEVELMEKFENIPQRPPFYASTTDLFFDPRIELRINPEQIKLDADDKARLQKACPSVSPEELDKLLPSRLKRTKNIALLSPRTAVPMYFPGTHSMFLLLPLHILNFEYPDIAIAIEKVSDDPHADPDDISKWYYRFVSLFSLPTAYKFARLIGRIESDWLAIPNQQIYTARAQALQQQLSAVNAHKQSQKKKDAKDKTPKPTTESENDGWTDVKKKK